MNKKITKDLFIVFFSIVIAYIIAKFGIFEYIIDKSMAGKFVGSFIAGLFFTSIFTTAPATVALGQIASYSNIFVVAFLGGLGAMIGDYILFRFFRDSIGADIAQIIKNKKRGHLKHLFTSKIGKRVMALVGGLIIASPLPDEIGLVLMGISKIKNRKFFQLSFLFNSIGILIIGLVANL